MVIFICVQWTQWIVNVLIDLCWSCADLVFSLYERNSFVRKCYRLWPRCSFPLHHKFSLKSRSLLLLYSSLDVYLWIVLIHVQIDLLIRVPYRIYGFQRLMLCGKPFTFYLWSTIPWVLHSWTIPRRNCWCDFGEIEAVAWWRRKWGSSVMRIHKQVSSR